MEWLLLAVLSALAGTLMGFLHYLIKVITGRDIGPPQTYVWGVGCGIWLPFALWCLLYYVLFGPQWSVWHGPVGLTAIIVGAGIGTFLSYLADDYRAAKNKAQKGERLLE